MVQPRVAPARPDPDPDDWVAAQLGHFGPLSPAQRDQIAALLGLAPTAPDWAGYQDAQLHAGPCSPAVCGRTARPPHGCDEADR